MNDSVKAVEYFHYTGTILAQDFVEKSFGSFIVFHDNDNHGYTTISYKDNNFMRRVWGNTEIKVGEEWIRIDRGN